MSYRFITVSKIVTFHHGFALLIASLLIVGCSGEKPQLKTFPVSGKILVDGKPPVRAEVRFKPKTPIEDPGGRSVEPHAIVNEAGLFEVGTYTSDDGAPPGEYDVTIVWPDVKIEGGEEIFGPDRLKGRFAKPESPVAKIEVTADGVEMPAIELHTQ